MRRSSKAILTLLCAVLLVVGSVFATVAYFTDTEAVTNTFTVGKVEITMDELDTDDSTADADRDVANKYHLIPGQTYTKDPTIHVAADSEECYLFVKVENGISAIETKEEGKTVADQMKAIGWELVPNTTNIYALAKGKDAPDFTYTVFSGADVEVFKTFTIDGDGVNNENIKPYKDANITVTAYAVQAAGFDDAKAAWTATFGKPQG